MSLQKLKGIKVNCIKIGIDTIIFGKEINEKYPLIISQESGDRKCIVPSPLHGRSIVVGYIPESNRYIITKGNGLTYFPYGYISTEEFDDHAWGLLREEDAVRDFISCNYVKSLGILTNNMEAVFTLEEQKVFFAHKQEYLKPAILQYSVKCPYRIVDIPFLSKNIVNNFTANWQDLFSLNYEQKHCIAAHILLKNIRIMHINDVLHNSIHSQNYSLSLELLDFELSRTPETPYENVNDESSFRKLKNREVIQSLEIVNQIALYFAESINLPVLKKIMIENGFENFIWQQ